ncbi:unnamed protein product [Cylicocyclus nassatus]|uniref:Uncharacterized protein n=1 Tax=Cylicocyclus nassatus TaxID=53992 RepID=A0AA36GEN5_CYLNA|nr:unnamed protein product [Cylicocyclus nassatus]
MGLRILPGNSKDFAAVFKDLSKEHYESNILPRYSKSTPYLYEEQLPLPVYGIAHGYPYRKKEKDSTDDYSIGSTQSSRQDDGDHTFHDELQKDTPEYPDDDKQYDGDYEADKEKSASKEPEEEEQEDGEDDTAQEQGQDESQEEDDDEEDAEEEPQGPEPEHNEQEYEEENSHANAEPEQANSREEYEEEHEKPERHHRYRHPNGNGSKESGNGLDSEHSDSAHYEDSGRGKKRRRYSGEQDSAEKKRTRPRKPPDGKVVGVNMGVVAGVYPHQSKEPKNEIPGRYSPLSGPFPSYEHEETTTRSTAKPKRKTKKYRKKHRQREHTRSPDYSSNRNRSQKSKERAKWVNVQIQDDATYAKTPQPIRYGPFDAYFVVRPEPSGRQQGEFKSFSSFPKGIQQQVSGTLSVKTPSGIHGYNEYPVDVVLQTRPAQVEPQLDKPPQSTQLDAQDDLKVTNYEKQTSKIFDVQSSSKAPYTDPAVQNSLSDRRPLAYENEGGYRSIDAFTNNCPNCRWSTANQTHHIPEHVPPKSSGASMEAREPDGPPKPPPFDFRNLHHGEYVDFGVRTRSQIPPSTAEHPSELPHSASLNLNSTGLSPLKADSRMSQRW